MNFFSCVSDQVYLQCAGLTDSVKHLESFTDVYLLSFGQKAYTVRAGARTCLYYESDYS